MVRAEAAFGYRDPRVLIDQGRLTDGPHLTMRTFFCLWPGTGRQGNDRAERALAGNGGERRTEDGERRTESGELKRGTNGNRRVKSRSGERADGQVARRRRTSTKNGRTAGVPTGISGGKRRAASVDRQEEPTYYTNGRKQDDGKQTYNKGEHVEQTEAGGRRQEAGGRRQEAGDRRQETGGRRQETGAKTETEPVPGANRQSARQAGWKATN